MNAILPLRRYTFYVLLFLLSPAYPDTIALFELKHRPAEKMIPIIKPLLQATDAISARDFQLFIRTDETTLAHITPLIAQLDTAPENLLIRIKYSSSETATDINYKKNAVTNRKHSTHSSYIPEILTLEGHPVFIHQEHSVPSISRILTRSNEYITEHPLMTYNPSENGIYVTPRLSGDDVILTIESKQQIPTKSTTYPIHAMSTQVRGKLGAWLPIGKVEQTQRNTKNNTPDHKLIKTQERHALHMYIKVERVNSK